MIEQIAQKLVTTYDNLPPKHKALADIVGVLFGVCIGVGFLLIAAYFDLWMQVAIGMLIYSIGGMIHLLYKSRVAHYEFHEKYNKK